MIKLLVDKPDGTQEIITVEQGGGYFDDTRILWDERRDGELPAITAGGMIRNGGVLEFSQNRIDEHLRAIHRSKFDIDKDRYSKRAAVKDELIAYMAADNMGRVRSGQWTVAELTGLMTDPDVSAATAYMGTLSYELAAQAIAAAETPLLTPEIKAAWAAKLQEHFYLTP